MRFIKSKVVYILTLAALFCQSCATILTPHQEIITFKSNPSGARVLIDGEQRGVTPCTIKIKRNLEGRHMVITKSGYIEQGGEIERSFNWVTILNIVLIYPFIIPPLVGVGIDLATGSFYKFDQHSYFFMLEPTEDMRQKLQESEQE